MSDTFLAHFETGKLHPFAHEDHIRMAWLYLRRDGWQEGYRQIQAGLKNFAAAHGQPEKYHETITRFWAMLVNHAIEQQPDMDSFADFQQAFPFLFDKSIIKKHYSKAVFFDAVARQQWVEPDIVPMPV
jgi:hypothetical protein